MGNNLSVCYCNKLCFCGCGRDQFDETKNDLVMFTKNTLHSMKQNQNNEVCFEENLLKSLSKQQVSYSSEEQFNSRSQVRQPSDPNLKNIKRKPTQTTRDTVKNNNMIANNSYSNNYDRSREKDLDAFKNHQHFNQSLDSDLRN